MYEIIAEQSLCADQNYDLYIDRFQSLINFPNHFLNSSPKP